MEKQKLKDIARDKEKYDLGAYQFVLEALSYTQEQRSPQRPGHISGEELLEGIKELGIHSFGPLGGMVLRSWGIENTEDIGNIVFDLVEAGLMGKQESDSPEDFSNGFDIEEVFWEEYEDAPLFSDRSR